MTKLDVIYTPSGRAGHLTSRHKTVIIVQSRESGNIGLYCGRILLHPFRARFPRQESGSRDGCFAFKGCDDMLKLKPTLEERFWSKVKIGEPNECWEWQASCNKSGRGQFTRIGGKHQVHAESHRLAYELTHGPIPNGLHVCHTCDNGLCCNPAHLFLGTKLDNERDKCNKGRQARGEKHGHAKLTESDVRQIRAQRECGVPLLVLAHEYGVAISCISSIAHRRLWGWLE
jgi:hypothetical protein